MSNNTLLWFYMAYAIIVGTPLWVLVYFLI